MEDKPASTNVPMERLDRPPRGALATFGLFLLGNGEAIRRLAATPRLWVVGLLFTFSAGLAREYDAEDLLAEPWHLLIAPGASWAAATVLWLLVQIGGFRRWMWSPARPSVSSTTPDTDNSLEPPPTDPPPAPRLLDSYLAFLGLFWLTAPLAWFYGVPFERVQSAGQAASSNLWLLTLIALWRVLLMIRVLHVLYGIGGVVASIIVLFFGNALMLAALFAVPVPIFAVMGGVRLGPGEQSLAFLAMAGKFVGTITLFILFLLWLSTVLDRKRWGWNVATTTVPLTPLTLVGVVAIAWWCAWLPVTQPEQQLRGRVERALSAGDVATAVAVLSHHPPEAFPPHWDPPPRIGYGQTKPEVIDVLFHLLDHPQAERMQEIYEYKLASEGYLLEGRLQRDPRLLERLVTILERSPHAERMMHPPLSPRERERYWHGVDWTLSRFEDHPDAGLRNRIQALRARHPEPKP
jgi:hypothetical protein